MLVPLKMCRSRNSISITDLENYGYSINVRYSGFLPLSQTDSIPGHTQLSIPQLFCTMVYFYHLTQCLTLICLLNESTPFIWIFYLTQCKEIDIAEIVFK